jgi:sarcosine oxidase, subunit alpha
MPRLDPIKDPVFIELDGESIEAARGENVAAALVARDEMIFSRSLKYHRARGAFCFTGSCSQCLMRVDGVPNVPVCRVNVKSGLRLERQNALPDARFDILRTNDYVFQKWFNHHEFMAGVPIVERVMLEIARKIAGLGLLPDKEAPVRSPAKIKKHGIVIVGAGAAGRAVSRRLHERAIPFLLLERNAKSGGRLLTEAAEGLPPYLAHTPARLNTEVVGLYEDTTGIPFLVAIENNQVELIYFETLILANGGHPSIMEFENNDLPGIMAGRAVSALIREHRVLPGNTVACVGEVDEARALAKLVESVGGKAVAVGATPTKAHGGTWVESIDVLLAKEEVNFKCDTIALCIPPSPAFELAKAAGALVKWSSSHHCFVVDADSNGRTSRSNVYAVGELRGPMSAAAASDQGIACGEFIVGQRGAL